MTRPTKRFGKVAAYGDVDSSRGEFWVESPWTYPPDLNLSAFEPNRVLLNATPRASAGLDFVDITNISGAGDTGDGRGVIVLDVDGDLAPDLVVRQSGGGPLKVFRNAFPKAARLQIELVGDTSNRRGIGALILVEAGGRRIARQLWANNNFLAQQGAQVRFGLGAFGKVKTADRVRIDWPSGKRTEVEDVALNRSIRIREKDGGVEELR